MPLLAALLLSVAIDTAPATPPAAPVRAPATAAAAEGCPAGPAGQPPSLAGWAVRAPLSAARSAASLADATLTEGRGADVALRPAETVAYAATPGKSAEPGGQAGLLALQVAAPGTYAVGLSSAAWIDVVDAQGAVVASTAHDHGPPCSGLRKVVEFPLATGRYVVQLTTGGEPVVGVIAFRR